MSALLPHVHMVALRLQVDTKRGQVLRFCWRSEIVRLIGRNDDVKNIFIADVWHGEFIQPIVQRQNRVDDFHLLLSIECKKGAGGVSTLKVVPHPEPRVGQVKRLRRETSQ